jgi:DNA-binding YbaB/EbfC family protein
MKLPKNFGGQGLGNMMQQAKQAMERAKKLEEELENERIPIDKGPVKAIMDGTGQLVSIKIDPSVLDPEDVEALEDLVVSAVRDGFAKATELRNAKVGEIMPNIPGL